MTSYANPQSLVSTEWLAARLELLETKRKLRQAVMENGSRIDGPFFDGSPKVGEPLRFSYRVSNIDDGHNFPSGSLGAQPEICGNGGLAPRNAVGALILFGDLYAKAGDAASATRWYQLARGLSGGERTPYRFLDRIDGRLADVPGRVALYADADPTNDPPIIGAREEACAICHNR